MKKSKNGSPKKSQLGKREAPNKKSSLVQREASLFLASVMRDKKRRLAKLQKKKDKFKNKKLRSNERL